MKNFANRKIPHSPLMCDFSDTKESLKFRFSSLFDDSKKKKGIISLIVILVLIGIIGSFFAFGNKEVEQVNDSLTIYVQGTKHTENNITFADSYDYEKVIQDYKKEYPDVKVEIVEHYDMSVEAFADKITTEILTGKGPDIIMFDDRMMQFKDVNKIIASGLIAPIDEFLAADETFKLDDYYQGLLKSGIYRNKRYALPMRFNTSVIASGENVLKDAGLDKDLCKNGYIDLMEQCTNYVNSNIDNADAQLLFTGTFTYRLLDYVGGNPTKENKKIDTPEFRTMAEGVKMLRRFKPDGDESVTGIPSAKLLERRNLIFSGLSGDPLDSLSAEGAEGITPFDKPVLIPLRKPNGNMEAIITDVAMINANSSNKQNAYNLIKQMISYNFNHYYWGGLASKRAFSEYNIRESGRVSQYYPYEGVDISKTLREETKEIVNSVDSASFATPITNIIKTELQPFFDGTMSYEDCIKQAQSKVDLYFSE